MKQKAHKTVYVYGRGNNNDRDKPMTIVYNIKNSLSITSATHRHCRLIYICFSRALLALIISLLILLRILLTPRSSVSKAHEAMLEL